MSDSNLSIDKMVEMAMGFSMGSLFAKSMNDAYANSAARLNNNQLNEPPRFIHAIVEGKQAGPFSEGEVLALIQQGSITQESYIWKPGMPEWKRASEVDQMKPSFNTQVPEPPKE